MNRTSRTVAVSDPLWTALETMSREMGVDRDVLLNQAIFSLARQFGFITPTQVNLLDVAASAPQAPAPLREITAVPVQAVAVAEPAAQLLEKPREESPRVDVAEPRRDLAEDADTGGPPTELSMGEGPEGAAPGEPEPVETKAAQPDADAQAPKVDVEALRQGVVARMRELIADVDRLVEPVDERLRAEEADSEDEEDPDADIEAASEVSEAEEDAAAEDDAKVAAPVDAAASNDDDAEGDEGSDDDDLAGDEASDDAADEDDEASDDAGDEDDEASDDGDARAAVGAGRGNATSDASPAGTGGSAPTPKPPAPVETTIIVPTTSGVPLHIRLDEGEPVRVSRERFIIGRGAHCDLVVKSARVSREHAAVVKEGAEFFIEDLTSSNGTWFDNTRITRRLVSDGEEYLLGGIRVTFTLG